MTNKYRSKFEKAVAGYIGKRRVKFDYEGHKFKFIQPAKARTYNPDFYIPETGTYIETKGKLTPDDRTKLVWVREQNPGLKLVILFMKSNNPIRKGSKTTYADWADSAGMDWADFADGIPERWLRTDDRSTK